MRLASVTAGLRVCGRAVERESSHSFDSRDTQILSDLAATRILGAGCRTNEQEVSQDGHRDQGASLSVHDFRVAVSNDYGSLPMRRERVGSSEREDFGLYIGLGFQKGARNLSR